MPNRPKRPAEGPAVQESGATRGETHEQVLDRTVGRERRLRSMLAGGPPPGDEA